MQFKLTNMGRIGTADIALNGITVIAGPNGSGKSTISRALFTWFNCLRNLEEDIPSERLNAILKDIEDALVKGGMSLNRASHFISLYFHGRQPKRFIDESFWRDEGKSKEWWINRLTNLPWQWRSADGAISMVNQVYEQIRQRAFYWLNKDEMEIAQFVATRCFARAFDEQVGTYFNERAATEVSLKSDCGITQASLFFGGVSSSHNVVCSNGDAYKGMQMFYLEPTHMLDDVPTELRRSVRKSSDNRYSANKDVRWAEIIPKELRKQDMSLPQAERLKPIFEELDKIVSTIHGEIVRDETKLVFKDTDLPSDKTVSLRNIASGAKSMAAIVRGMRNDSIHPGDFIIIDEPESNLHPEWQVQFAKFLVLLHAKFGIRFLLNTHSPYFLKAIEVYSDSYEKSDDCSFYNMVSQDGRQYSTNPVNGKLQDIYKDMSKPFSKLMRGESYERTIS